MTHTVLIVDDEEMIRELVSEWLGMSGYETCTASNGHEGLRQLYEKRPDLVISDMRMPEMDGSEFCRLVRVMCDVPIIMVTGVQDELEKMQLLNPAIDAYMSKPVGLDKLVDQIADLLGRKESSDVAATM